MKLSKYYALLLILYLLLPLYKKDKLKENLNLQDLPVMMEDLKMSKELSMQTSKPSLLLSQTVMISLKVRLETTSSMVEVTCLTEETS